MFDDFNPQEKKAIIVFLALLVLGLVYIGTNGLPIEQPYELHTLPAPDADDSAAKSGRYL